MTITLITEIPLDAYMAGHWPAALPREQLLIVAYCDEEPLARVVSVYRRVENIRCLQHSQMEAA